ncbi:MAG: hypothetical protein RTV72_00655 [Candidatus Thorarchaeota archaeon]
MGEKKFMNVLQRACDEKVKVTIVTNSKQFFLGRYVVEIGEDYVKFTASLKKKSTEEFIKLECIESISTKWEE